MSESLSSSSQSERRRLFGPRVGAAGGCGVEATVWGGGVGRGDAGRATLRVRGERRGGLMGRGLWRRWGLTDRRGVGAGDPSKDCSARQVPRRPFPEA